MNEDDVARRVADRLEQRLNELPTTVTGRLAEIRRRAVSLARTPAPVHVRLGHWVAGHRLMVGVACFEPCGALLRTETMLAQIVVQQDNSVFIWLAAIVFGKGL